MTKEMKRPTSHISGNNIKPALSKAVEFYIDNNRQAYECIHERDEYIDYLESKLSNAKPQQALPVVPEDVAKWIDGYQVEKPQLFYIALPKIFGLSDSTRDSTFVSKAESGIILEFTNGKNYALKLTEQEIKSIDERYWQFAVPVEDGE